MKVFYFFVFLILFFTNCKSVKTTYTSKASEEDKIISILTSDSILRKHFNGFQLYNLTTNSNVIAHNERLLFTPASNIKLLTYLTCLHILEDSISTFKYWVDLDTVYVIPQGDPSFLNNSIDSNQLALRFLIAQNKPIQVYKNSLHDISELGAGWAWEDSQYSFQSPLSFFPLYGNRVRFRSSERIYSINVSPKYFKPYVENRDTFKTFIKRDRFKNVFYFNDKLIPKSYDIERPFISSDNLTRVLLQDTIKRPVSIIEQTGTFDWPHFKSLTADSLYKKILFESDNHVADQMLLMCSNTQLGYMNTEDIIKYSIDSILNLEKKEIKWVDGSGLSRYNLVSPNVFINVLKSIYKRVGLETIKRLFPVGGKGDTLPSIFNKEKDWIYAKTGTLSNNFSMSGYIITDKNQIMAFSFLNNHYTHSKKEVSESMYKILKQIKTNF